MGEGGIHHSIPSVVTTLYSYTMHSLKKRFMLTS